MDQDQAAKAEKGHGYRFWNYIKSCGMRTDSYKIIFDKINCASTIDNDVVK